MYCTVCGIKNSQESNFCKQCGQRLDKPTTRISEEEFNRTLPDNEQISALMERAYALRVAGDLAGASALCEQALKLHPDGASAHSLLGQIYEQQGEKAKAISEYETVLAHNPASIADRVKLDQLRDGGANAAKSGQVVVNHPVPNSPPNIFAMIGVGAALILVGAVAANQLRPATAPANTGSNDTVRQNAGVNPNMPLLNTSNPISNHGTQQPVLPGTVASNATGIPASNSPNVASSFGSPFFPPIQVYTGAAQPARERTRPSYPFVNTGSGEANTPPLNTAQVDPPTNLTNKTNGAVPGTTGGTRTHLASNDGVVQGEDGNYKIVVDASGTGSGKTGDSAPTRPTPTNSGNGKSEIKIKMAPTNGTGQKTGSETVNTASGDARTAISLGKELKLRGDYNRAISSFKKALATAGDDTGYVYQEIGKCYQDKGDKDSAIVSYERAISEFQKLVESGHGAENARNALRTCQNGIKVCKSD